MGPSSDPAWVQNFEKGSGSSQAQAQLFEKGL